MDRNSREELLVGPFPAILSDWNANHTSIKLDENLRSNEPLLILSDQLLRQAVQMVSIRRSTTKEECSGNGIVNFAGLVSQTSIQWESQQLAFLMANQDYRIIKWIDELNGSSYYLLH